MHPQTPPRQPRRLLALIACFVSFASSLPATITIQADQEFRDVPTGFGGTGIGAYHKSTFRTHSTINFGTHLKSANIRSARIVGYPDFKADGIPHAPNYNAEETHDRAWFDATMTWMQNAGVKAPVLVFYTDPTPHSSTQYYTFGGSSGGTLGSNIAYFVKRYTSAPYNFDVLYVEVHNEPDMQNLDYFYGWYTEGQNPAAYVKRYKEIFEALCTYGVRDKVQLCGPVMSRGYYESWSGDNPNENTVKGEAHSRIFNEFLKYIEDNGNWDPVRQKKLVDVITWHVYPGGELDASKPGSVPSLPNLLNAPKHMDGKLRHDRTVSLTDYNQTSMTANRGIAGLLKRISGNPAFNEVGFGITEYNVPFSDDFYTPTDRALYNLCLNSFALYTPKMELTTSFAFDDIVSRMQFISPQGYYAKNYWGQWAMNNYLGDVVLKRIVSGAANPHLLVSATKDAEHIYVWVVNRSANPISNEFVTISGVPVKSTVSVATLNSGTNPNDPATTHHGGTFLKTFPAYSATFYRFDIDGVLINRSGGFPAASMTLNQQASLTSNELRLLNNAASAKGTAYHTDKVPVGSFNTEFEFAVTSPSSPADGLTFLIQNYAPTAVGNHGSGLGCVGIPKSVAIKLEYWGTSSTGVYSKTAAGGETQSTFQLPTSLNLGNGNRYNVKASYSGTALRVIIKNTVTGVTDTRDYSINIPAILGTSTAYVGFSAGSGGNTSTVRIPFWTYSQ